VSWPLLMHKKWPDPSLLLTRRNKMLTRLWPGYFSTRPKEIFLTRREKKWKIFQIQTQTINGWPDPTQPNPQKIDPTRSGSKNFDPDPSLGCPFLNNAGFILICCCQVKNLFDNSEDLCWYMLPNKDQMCSDIRLKTWFLVL